MKPNLKHEKAEKNDFVKLFSNFLELLSVESKKSLFKRNSKNEYLSYDTKISLTKLRDKIINHQVSKKIKNNDLIKLLSQSAFLLFKFSYSLKTLEEIFYGYTKESKSNITDTEYIEIKKKVTDYVNYNIERLVQARFELIQNNSTIEIKRNYEKDLKSVIQNPELYPILFPYENYIRTEIYEANYRDFNKTIFFRHISDLTGGFKKSTAIKQYYYDKYLFLIGVKK